METTRAKIQIGYEETNNTHIHLCRHFLYQIDHLKQDGFTDELYNLRENIFADVHTCSNLHLGAKEQNSKRRQDFEALAYCPYKIDMRHFSKMLIDASEIRLINM